MLTKSVCFLIFLIAHRCLHTCGTAAFVLVTSLPSHLRPAAHRLIACWSLMTLRCRCVLEVSWQDATCGGTSRCPASWTSASASGSMPRRRSSCCTQAGPLATPRCANMQINNCHAVMADGLSLASGL